MADEKGMADEKATSADQEHKQERAVTEWQGLDNRHYRDSSSKTIFKDPILCSQFLRNYVDIPMLKDVQPEDIEDVTERFVHLFVEERDSDIVKKVHLKNNSFYLISLIEHKSDVDYNVVMQVFRYITFIWEDYENEQEKNHTGISKTKGFRYPPVLPVVFYDGVDNWTAATSLHERVLFSDILGKYIPDYQCMLVQLKEYSNAELVKKKDELSVLMMFDKLRNVSDYGKLREELDETFLKEVIRESPEYLLKLMTQIIEMFLSKLNVPKEEADTFTGQIRGRKMGELFKHFEGWDIQAVRREAREMVEKAKEEAKEETEKIVSESIQKFLKCIRKHHVPRESAVADLMEEYGLSEERAIKEVEKYW